jgi:hypothetical protein
MTPDLLFFGALSEALKLIVAFGIVLILIAILRR